MQRALFVAVCCWAATVSAAGADAGKPGPINLAKLRIDPRIRNTPATGVYLAKVRPAKLFFWQGDPVAGEVTLVNNTDAAKKLAVAVWLTNDIAQRVGRQDKKLTVRPYSIAIVKLRWAGSVLKPYGHAMACEVRLDGKVISRGSEVFSTADNVWAVGLAGFHPTGGYTADRVKSRKRVEDCLEIYRAHYVNTFEKFFWAPDDFGEMTPSADVWYSGQARYHESAKWLKYLCEYGRKIGVLPTTYGKNIGSGTGARDLIRARPEMVYGFGGRMAYGPDTEELAKWDKLDSTWQATAWAFYNMNDPAVVQHGIDEIIASSKQFGWAGVRFDGHFAARTGKQRVGDKTVEFTRDMADAQTAANIRTLKAQVRKRYPRYVFGYNYAECGFERRLLNRTRETLELCAGGGHIMDEYAKSNLASGHPFRRWADYARMIVREAEQVRRLGGHLFPIVHKSGAVGRYQTLFALAGGAHPYGSFQKGFNRFATRYASLIWHEKIRNVWNPNGLVIIGPGVMWENYVREIPLGPGRKRLVVHLLNPPLQATATESAAIEAEINRRIALRRKIRIEAAGKKVKPDYGELDSLAPLTLYPGPQKNVRVRLVPRALGKGWKITRAVLLAPDATGRRDLPVDRSDRYFVQVTVPEVKFWAVLVFDIEKGS